MAVAGSVVFGFFFGEASAVSPSFLAGASPDPPSIEDPSEADEVEPDEAAIRRAIQAYTHSLGTLDQRMAIALRAAREG